MEKKELISLFWIVVYIVGLIGGLGFALDAGAYFIAICIGLLGVMSFDKFLDNVKTFG